MKFLLLMAEPDHFAHWAEAGAEHRERVVADFHAFHAAVRERGSILAGEALDEPGAARTVRPGPDPGPGRPVTDGPFTETVEQLGGFYLLNLPSLRDALELASLLPREYAVEVRPTVEVDL